ncbi:MAG: hybrid sensor histidine kinase/response regulator [Gammaproteobacteria bacterium]|nr:hybrid sensor histidine kinase/response regulator [Gammaproteobacteria bacterium]
MDDLIVEFITETNESLEELDMDIVNLEKNPNDADLLGKIFRLVHTIKGTCGFLSLPRLEKVAHHAENVLGKFRDGVLEVTPDYVTLIFESIDQIKYIVGEIEETGEEPDGDDGHLIARLDAAHEGKVLLADGTLKDSLDTGTSTTTATENTVADTLSPTEELSSERNVAPGDATEAELEAAFANAPGMDGISNPSEDEIETIEKIDNSASERNVAPGDATEAELEAAFANAPGMDGISNPSDQPAKQEQSKPNPNTTKAVATKPKTVQTLRVNVDVLEDLMTMVSELVLTRNQLLQILRAHEETEFSIPLQRLSHVVSDLQEGVMKTRMQPVGNAWSKLPRIIRDLSIELGKKIDLVMTGNETELDRQVLEMIKDPLTHMVRNSGDHGIETPAERVAVGKQETGTIRLDAFHEGGHIIIRISDDGKGLSEDKIKEKIYNNGLATQEEIDAMSKQQINQFIFAAGFSTAAAVTSVSGRGVGMDVVRTNIEKIGGAIELKSDEGKGSTFTIKIPLTLAIVSALVVEAGGERFAIPQLAVRELVMVSEHGDSRVEYIKGSPVFRLRDRLLPLVSLSNILGLSEKELLKEVKTVSDNTEDKSNSNSGDKTITTDKRNEGKKNLYLIITEVGGYVFGIIVDRVFDTEEIVVKPVAEMLKGLTIFSGNTILGDGSVIMILDPNGIANATGNITSADELNDANEQNRHKSTSERKTSLLLFTTGDKTPKAVPLALVARLENINSADIEYSSGQMTTQYRGALMPLVPFDTTITVNDKGSKPVLVFSDKEQSLGIIVDDIVDIIDEHLDIQLSTQKNGLLGSAIINGIATDVVDIAHFLDNAKHDWFKDHGDSPYISSSDGGNDSHKKRLLLIDDSSFFRNMLTPLLSMAGYDVTSLEKPSEALQMREEGVIFDVIVSDIEMPDMNGFEFAQHVKSDDGRWADVPMIALSSHATPQDIERGTQVGFSNYVAKFDKDTLLNTLSQTFTENKTTG